MTSFRRSICVAILIAAPSTVLTRALQRATVDSRLETVGGKRVVAREVLVKFRNAPDLASIHAALEVDADEIVGSAGVRRVHSRARGTAALIAALERRGDVEYVEPNYVVHTTLIPNDTNFPLLWGLQNIGQSVNGSAGVPGADIAAPAAWNVTTGSRASVVAVVDTGVDYTHPDLSGNMWSAPTAFSVVIGGRTITCAAGTHGFNAVTNTCDPMDDNNHGTHVAGTIGAIGNNAAGVVGVNQVASIMAAKFIDSSGTGTTSAAINAIEFAIQAKAAFAASGSANVRVLSNSWGGDAFSQSLLNEVNKANANGMLFVAAAGNASSNNDVTPFYPANLNAPNVVAVAATDSTDHVASFSNYGQNTVHLGAPGVSILSTIRGGGYAYFSGTSMATPHVSGAAALVLSACSLNTAALKSLLLTRVDLIAALSTVTVSGGRLDVASALFGCAAPNAPPTVSLTSPAAGANFVAPATVALTASASDADGSVNSVRFYVNAAEVGASTTSPYSASWNAATAGTYSITAVATDNRGATTTSAPVAVTVSDPVVAASQTLLTTQVPVGQNLSDGAMWELGMRFVSDVAGQITGLRFWKSSLDAGPHVGRLWSATGQVLATVTFSNETASGWQQQSLAAPVAIAANTEYVVTVTTGPGGYFVATYGGFATALTSGHLQAPAGANGIYDGVGVFPTRTFSSSNYFRDIVFVAGAGTPGTMPPTPDTTPPTVTVTQPAPGGVVGGLVTVAATAQDNVAVAGVQFQVDGVPIGGEVPTAPYSISWDSRGATNGLHVVSARARDAAGNQATASVTVTVSNAAAVPSQTLLTTQVPVGQNLSDGSMWELGMRFVSDVAGQITALRFWKSSLDAGPHVGRLWSATGQVLATVTFSNETASGWQQQPLAAPVAIAANTEYVVTVTTGPGGYFVATYSGFATGLTSGHLHAPAGANGIFDSVGVFPTRTFSSSNYFRDIVFVAQ
jgi:subtilisin family serine protease